MGNLPCCEGTIDSNTFRDYCSVAASEPYKPYLVQLQNREIHQTGEPQPSDQPIVLGNWQNQASKTGEGIIFAPDKFYYEGEISEGVAKGVGRIVWPSKAVFKGSVQNNRAQGQGSLQFDQGRLQLKGLWNKGFPKLNHKFELIRQGKKGSITFIDVTQLDGEETYFKELSLEVEIHFQSGISYSGNLNRKKNGFKIDGHGTMKYPDGSYYIGDFEAGRMHGKGKYFWAKTGHWYEGEYKSNFRQGWGRYYFTRQDFEQGQWMGGIMVRRPQEQNPLKQAYYSQPLRNGGDAKAKQQQQKGQQFAQQ